MSQSGWLDHDGAVRALYSLTPRAAANWLARLHAAIAIPSILVMVPGFAIAITTGEATTAAIHALLSALSMAIFIKVLRHRVVPYVTS